MLSPDSISSGVEEKDVVSFVNKDTSQSFYDCFVILQFAGLFDFGVFCFLGPFASDDSLNSLAVGVFDHTPNRFMSIFVGSDFALIDSLIFVIAVPVIKSLISVLAPDANLLAPAFIKFAVVEEVSVLKSIYQ